jgi:hypothetical protein
MNENLSHELDMSKRRVSELTSAVRELTALVGRLNGVVINLESRLSWLEGKVARDFTDEEEKP